MLDLVCLVCLKFKLKNVTEIIDIINKLKPKSSSGVDDLSNKVIKHIQEIIAEPLTIIINQMLNTGIFPDSLKISKVLPLFKKIMTNFFQIIDLYPYCLQYLKYLKRLFLTKCLITLRIMI